MGKKYLVVKGKNSKVIETPYGNVKTLIGLSQVSDICCGLGMSTMTSGAYVKQVHDFSDTLVFVLSGKGKISFDNKNWLEIAQNDAVFIKKGKEHEIKNVEKVDLKVVYFSTPLAAIPSDGHRFLN
ncbi:cupin domain-containing protein [Lactiplantibacillus plantarum]